MRRHLTVFTLALSATLLASCSWGTIPPSAPTTTTQYIQRTSTVVTATHTITSTPPLPTLPTLELKPEPEPVVGTCPYLADEFVKKANGQGLGPTKTVALEPHVGCEFFRSNGGWNVASRVYLAPNPQAATALVDTILPRATSNPATLEGGWSGGAMKFKPGTDPRYPHAEAVFGVSKGPYAVIVWTNQDRSFPAQKIAAEAIKNLGLS